MSMTIRVVYADFNNCDAKNRIRLNTDGTRHDLEKMRIRLREGMVLRLSDGELIGEGVVSFSEEEDMWLASIDWDNVVDLS